MKSHNLEHLRKIFSNFHSRSQCSSTFTPSAVLVILLPTQNELSLILTARSSNLNHHAGEMSFPGGRYDPTQDTDFIATALREVEEEIGIRSNYLEVLGELNYLPTITGYCIHPYIAWYHGPIPIYYQINQDEVSEVVEIPLSFLKNMEKFSLKTHYIKKKASFSTLHFDFTQNMVTNTNSFENIPHQINSPKFHVWGATAHILADFLKVGFEINKIPEGYFRPNPEDIEKYLQKKKLFHS